MKNAATILVVEDEQHILRLIRVSLAKVKGYKVLVAKSAEEGLKIAAESRRRIDLLLSNVMLPGMSGTELAQRIKVKRPGMCVVLIDGKGNGRLALLARQTGWQVLRKTQTGEALLEVVRMELERMAVPAPLKRSAAGRTE